MVDKPGVGQKTFVIGTWTLCAVALITMMARTGTRLHIHRKMQIDDYLLLLASICLLVATVLTQTQQQNFYRVARIRLNPKFEDLPKTYDEYKRIVHAEINFLLTFTALMWTTIHCAKFAYLLFFRRLIQRMKSLMWYWWVVCGMTILSYVAAMVHNYADCPWTDLRVVECSAGSRFLIALKLFTAMTVLDVVTDILICSIPVVILTKVQLKLSQKFGLALFLCLSMVLASVAIIRISRLETRSVTGEVTSNDVWGFFWLQAEGCLAISVVSLTAFRSLFIVQDQRRQEEQARKAWCPNFIRRLATSLWETSPRSRKLPSIPRAIITGLRSFFQDNDFTETRQTDEEKTLRENSRCSEVIVGKTVESSFQEINLVGKPQRPYMPETSNRSF